MVDVILILLALGILAALVLMRIKPGKGQAAGDRRSAGLPASHPLGGRAARALPPPANRGRRPALPHASGPPVTWPVLPAAQGPVASAPAAPQWQPHPPQISPGAPPPAAWSPGRPVAVQVAVADSPAPANPTAVLTPASQAGLEVLTGEESGKTFALLPGDNRLGRGRGCQICLPDPAVSNQHAILRVDGPQVTLFDDSSTNGTFVNGEQVLEPRVLQEGDQITVGRTTLCLRGSASAH